MSGPFAQSADLADRWRTLSTAEATRADVLLSDASAILRSLDSTIDDRITDETLDSDVPVAIVCAMVKRVMQGPTDMDGVTQASVGSGPFSQGVTFANPSGDLYLTKFERRRLGIGAQRAFTIVPAVVEDDEDDDEDA